MGEGRGKAVGQKEREGGRRESEKSRADISLFIGGSPHQSGLQLMWRHGMVIIAQQKVV